MASPPSVEIMSIIGIFRSLVERLLHKRQFVQQQSYPRILGTFCVQNHVALSASIATGLRNPTIDDTPVFLVNPHRRRLITAFCRPLAYPILRSIAPQTPAWLIHAFERSATLPYA